MSSSSILFELFLSPLSLSFFYLIIPNTSTRPSGGLLTLTRRIVQSILLLLLISSERQAGLALIQSFSRHQKNPPYNLISLPTKSASSASGWTSLPGSSPPPVRIWLCPSGPSIYPGHLARKRALATRPPPTRFFARPCSKPTPLFIPAAPPILEHDSTLGLPPPCCL